MAATQGQSSAGAAGVSAGGEPEHLQPPQVSCWCARCVQRIYIAPRELCLLPENPSKVVGSNTVCSYCREQRGRCFKTPARLQPQILELQQRAADLVYWQDANAALPAALRSSWAFPVKPLAVYTDLPATNIMSTVTNCNWPAYTPAEYKALHAAQRVVIAGVNTAQRGIPGWAQMSIIDRNNLLKLDPVVTQEDGAHGYWW